MGHSDHRAVVSEFSEDDFLRGPSRWHFNASYINDNQFLQKMNNQIEEFLAVQDQNLDNGVSKRNKWELLKSRIKTVCMQYGRYKKMLNSESGEREKELDNIAKQLANHPEDMTVQKHYEEYKKRLEIEQLVKARGAAVWSKAKWIEEGDRNTKYFLNLEKNRSSSNVIRHIKNERNEIVQNPGKVLSAIKNFYDKLFSRDKNLRDTESKLNTFMQHCQHPTLTQEERDACDTHITIEEMGAALKQLNNESAPGCDGITAVFYKTFWRLLKAPLFDCFRECLEVGELSISQRRGIITLIHKGKNTSRDELGNWRPITLTNVDYKIYTKVLALRLQQVTKQILNENQCGFIKGRNIANQIRLIDDVIKFAEEANIDGLVVSLDYQKAFETVNKECIMAALKQFNFGPNFIQFIKTMLTNTHSAVTFAGWVSEWFPSQRGMRQGCCVSPLLFVLVVELLARKIREDDEIKGPLALKLQDNIKLVQYADDMTLLLKDEDDLNHALDIIDSFSNISGLRLNKNKSLSMWIGSSKTKDNTHQGISWIKIKEQPKYKNSSHIF
ncbi:retrovirus-related Pol polyprotein from type-1 retrotransposable element R2 [Elysia marginata]|uniref:Retrovirus-related Pol polyprotein from type-1 retrotransposable element R2 n=1 Tax=Elysia marginata TaxID=1093978 RepID=A0AAV4G6K4_9GAST|nr:retrovirus-related Pol polyprotein from type-1 retrotransposable element R2 [Elysia marginata]